MKDILIELQKLIGRSFEYEGIGYEVIEVLAEDHAIVIWRQNIDDEVQMDQFGEPRRHGHKTHLVPLLSDSGHDLHPVVRALLNESELEKLRNLLPPGKTS